MSRSGYNDDCDGWALICWRGAVERAIRGKRGQAFLEEMLHAMAALPERELISHELENNGAVCAIGSVGKARGIDMKDLDPEDRGAIAKAFNIAPALAAEIVWMNDEAHWTAETPGQRFNRMRKWIKTRIYAGPATRSDRDTDGVRS